MEEVNIFFLDKVAYTPVSVSYTTTGLLVFMLEVAKFSLDLFLL